MQITAKLHGTLRKYLPAGSAFNATAVEVPDGATVAEVVGRLGIPTGHAKMIVSDNEQLELSSLVRDGQELNLFPPLAGGV